MRLSEEQLNTITHAVGFILSLAGLGVMIVIGSGAEQMRQLVAAMIFGFSLALVYFASTLYHGTKEPGLKALFNVIDHLAIFILIGGTYTPFALYASEVLGKQMEAVWYMIVIRGFVGLAVLCKIFYYELHKRSGTAFYLFLVWIVMLGIKVVLPDLDPAIVQLLILGVAMYSIGLIFFVRERFAYNHTIWHLFVMIGSGLHFVAILQLL